MVWYFIGVYIINRTLHGRLEKMSLLVLKNISLVRCPHLWKIFQHSKRNFDRISARPCNILYLPKTISYYPLPPHNRHYLLSLRWLLWRGLTVVHAVSLFSYWRDIIYFSITYEQMSVNIDLGWEKQKFQKTPKKSSGQP